MKLILTCEHATNLIPPEFRNTFSEAEKDLNSHRGYDLGALDLFLHLEKLADFSRYYEWSRLLIEPNRSLHHKNLFSKFTKGLSPKEREAIVHGFYFPYRKTIENKIFELIQEGEKVLHFSVHSFTPELDGKIRNTEIGLLFDPEKQEEKQFCTQLKSNLIQEDPSLNIRFNYPYLGKSDGLTTYLRKKFPKNYLGIELEINQIYSNQNKMNFELKMIVFNALQQVLNK